MVVGGKAKALNRMRNQAHTLDDQRRKLVRRTRRKTRFKGDPLEKQVDVPMEAKPESTGMVDVDEKPDDWQTVDWSSEAGSRA